mmetsp:Transcript_3119/g.7273  ORF Transcript_3119/g.7273 Transcript_3119/m.7273 type:complete len:492 (-) Transcript_3119:111-1586(-)
MLGSRGSDAKGEDASAEDERVASTNTGFERRGTEIHSESIVHSALQKHLLRSVTPEPRPKEEIKTPPRKQNLKPGTRVMYKSPSAGGWLETKVIQIQPDGRVDLVCREGADVNRIKVIDESKRETELRLRQHWAVGDLIEVYSRSQRQWFPTKIQKISVGKTGTVLHTMVKDVQRDDFRFVRTCTDSARREFILSHQRRVWSSMDEMDSDRSQDVTDKKSDDNSTKSASSKVPRNHSFSHLRQRSKKNSQEKYRPSTLKRSPILSKKHASGGYDTMVPDRNQRTMTFDPGENVLYYSSSQGGWIEAEVQDTNDDGTVMLNIKANADPSKIRPIDASLLFFSTSSSSSNAGTSSPLMLTVKHAQNIKDKLKEELKELECKISQARIELQGLQATISAPKSFVNFDSVSETSTEQQQDGFDDSSPRDNSDPDRKHGYGLVDIGNYRILAKEMNGETLDPPLFSINGIGWMIFILAAVFILGEFHLQNQVHPGD